MKTFFILRQWMPSNPKVQEVIQNNIGREIKRKRKTKEKEGISKYSKYRYMKLFCPSFWVTMSL